MSFLALFKQAEAQRRAAHGTAPSDAINAVNAESNRASVVVSSSVTEVATYEAALHDFWRLVMLGPGVDWDTATRAADEVTRLIDVVGEPAATDLRHRWEAEWYRETGRCPQCGETGERHT